VEICHIQGESVLLQDHRRLLAKIPGVSPRTLCPVPPAVVRAFVSNGRYEQVEGTSCGYHTATGRVRLRPQLDYPLRRAGYREASQGLQVSASCGLSEFPSGVGLNLAITDLGLSALPS